MKINHFVVKNNQQALLFNSIQIVLIIAFSKWASFWDSRDRNIRIAQVQGIQDVQVVEIDHIIDRVGDLSRDPGYWYNACAAMYYHVNTIRADLPGWDQ